jgi:hypothetical protein
MAIARLDRVAERIAAQPLLRPADAKIRNRPFKHNDDRAVLLVGGA